jgi:hypothetical protein
VFAFIPLMIYRLLLLPMLLPATVEDTVMVSAGTAFRFHCAPTTPVASIASEHTVGLLGFFGGHDIDSDCAASGSERRKIRTGAVSFAGHPPQDLSPQKG